MIPSSFCNGGLPAWRIHTVESRKYKLGVHAANAANRGDGASDKPLVPFRFTALAVIIAHSLMRASRGDLVCQKERMRLLWS